MRHPTIAAGGRIGPVLDLGCGTGLVGLAIGDMVQGAVTGVDVSTRMLDQARIKDVYTALIEADIQTALADGGALAGQRWPLIIAADVLCYFGALDDVMTAVHPRLEPGGWFMFSLEALLPDHDGNVPGNGEWALLRQGRYAHAVEYVSRVVLDAGFVIRSATSEVIRFEAGVPVEGMMLILERPRHDS